LTKKLKVEGQTSKVDSGVFNLRPSTFDLRPTVAGAILVLLLVACGAAPKTSVTPAATPAATPAGPRVVLPSGATYTLEVVRTPEEQAQGLMFRESLPEKTGMLFPFKDKGVHQFWMKNTMIPLDMVWMDADGKVIFVSADTPPCRADPCPSYGPDAPAASVLEIAGGKAAKEKITVGSSLKFVNVP
jgi:uncharacterized membrane protein (UPF0127 family)